MDSVNKCTRCIPLAKHYRELLTGYPEQHIERIKYEAIIQKLEACAGCGHDVYTKLKEEEKILRREIIKSRKKKAA